MHQSPSFRIRGFSLVELSIVLVILGLLIGGILAGKSLIHAAELRAVSTEYNRYLTATRAFRDKYFAIPGDMSNATSFWGKADPIPSVCRGTESYTTATCDGNGDGILSYTGSYNEFYAFWKHLANAGLIEGSYTGTGSAAGGLQTPTSLNAPTSKFPNSLWTAYNYNGVTPNSQRFQIEYGNFFILSTPITTPANNVIGSSNMNGADAWNIDTKLDDGAPATGKVIATAPSAGCSTGSSNTDLTSVYNLNPTPVGNYCLLFFRQLF